ncbi:MAG TPA: DUF2510 domain-containing protein [Gryllotalpicola sp.]
MSNAAPPGWYPDPWQQAAQRFWDGTQWTHRIAGGGAPVDRPPLREDAPIYGPFIWIIALLPIVTAVTIWFIHIDIGSLVHYVAQVQQSAESGDTTTVPMFDVSSLYGAGYWWNAGLGWGVFFLTVVLAYFDQRRLSRIGVLRPFGWGWAFLTSIVYVIGRSVVVRKVAAPRGLAPIWVLIAAYAISLVASTIWAVTFLSQLLHELGGTFPTA